jgi:hypothetical protein
VQTTDTVEDCAFATQASPMTAPLQQPAQKLWRASEFFNQQQIYVALGRMGEDRSFHSLFGFL